MLRVNDEKVTFNVFEPMKHSMENDQYLRVDMVDSIASEVFWLQNTSKLPLEAAIANSVIIHDDDDDDEKGCKVNIVQCSKFL